MVEELLLGDNPFIGVSHLSQEKAREETRETSLARKVMVFEAAIEGGATGFTFSTHEGNLELLTHLNAYRSDLLNRINYYILLPYVQSYVRRANTRGTPSLVRSVLTDIIFDVSTIHDMVTALMSLKLERLAGLFARAELSPYLDVLPKERVKGVLLHEILTDCIVAFGLTDVFDAMRSYVEERLGLTFGLHTKNFGHLCGQGVFNMHLNEYVMTSVNPLGYMMAPSRQAVEEAIEKVGKSIRIIAINTLAAGAMTFDRSVEYLSGFRDKIYAVTSASSKPERAYENFRRLHDLLL